MADTHVQEDMDKTEKKNKHGDAIIAVPAILIVIAFFWMAAVYNFDPGLIFQKLFGFITVAAVILAIGAFVLAILIRIFGFLFGKK